jgi:hypothetical protein
MERLASSSVLGSLDISDLDGRCNASKALALGISTQRYLEKYCLKSHEGESQCIDMAIKTWVAGKGRAEGGRLQRLDYYIAENKIEYVP